MAEIRLNDHISLSDEKINPMYQMIREENGDWTVRNLEGQIMWTGTKWECWWWLVNPRFVTMEE